jgi:hypothetical protein
MRGALGHLLNRVLVPTEQCPYILNGRQRENGNATYRTYNKHPFQYPHGNHEHDGHAIPFGSQFTTECIKIPYRVHKDFVRNGHRLLVQSPNRGRGMDYVFYALFRVLEVMFVVGMAGCVFVIPVAAIRMFSVLFEKDTEEEKKGG